MEEPIFSRTAAALAAAALVELYPNVEPTRARETSIGFSSHFFFPHPISGEMLFQLEEKMRQLVREKRPIRTLEMVPLSARELLLKEGRRTQARELEGKGGLVHLAQIGSFYDVTSGPLLKNTMELGACKLLSLEPEGKKGLRICGVARQSKKELKDFLKRWAAYPKTNHQIFGEKEGFWLVREEGILWLPRGLEVRQKLIDFLKKELHTYWVECPPGVEKRELLLLGQRVGETVVEQSVYEEGLFEGGTQTVLQILEACPKSLLQTVRKSLMMLGFTFDEEMEPNFLVEDQLKRPWVAASLRAEKGFWVATIPVERNLALLIEKGLCKGTIFED